MHILVAEDNDINAKVINRWTKKIMGYEHIRDIPANFTMDRVRNGAEALAYLSNPRNPRPDIFFLDIQMPVIGGAEVLDRIRTQAPFVNNPYIQSIPIVAMNPGFERFNADRWIERGANDFIRKPPRLQDVRKVLLRWTKRGVVPSQNVGFGPGRMMRRPVWGPMPLRNYRGPRSLL